VKVNGETHYLWRAVDHEPRSRSHRVASTRCGIKGSFIALAEIGLHSSDSTPVTVRN